MNEIQVIKSKMFGEVRSYYTNGMMWLCLADICQALGIANNRDTLSRLNQAGVGLTDIGVETGIKRNGTQAKQIVKATFINEPNMYRLVLRSNKPQAEPFIDWVTSEVLPTLRRTGSYTEPRKCAIPGLEEMFGKRQYDCGDPLTNAIARDVWKAVDKVYLEWIKKATAQQALQEFKRQVGRA